MGAKVRRGESEAEKPCRIFAQHKKARARSLSDEFTRPGV